VIVIRSPEQLREDALAIWRAGVDAVRADQLVADNVSIDNDSDSLVIDEHPIALADVRRIIVVGAGKAGAGMAAGLENVLGTRLLREKRVEGCVNVPADCVRTLSHIRLHAARPAGLNEPTPEGVQGAEEILRLVSSADPRDLVIALISGGGSALLPAPVAGVPLADKQAITKFLSGAGANIQQLNTVRKQLSRIKGGGLARACRAGQLFALIIADVLGDPLDIIASGPTVEDPATPRDALAVLEKFGAEAAGDAPSIFTYLRNQAARPTPREKTRCEVTNLVIGNNAVAVDGAGVEAVRRGYSPAMIASRELEGAAEEIGRHIADMTEQMRGQPGPDCLITGGEPTVKLAPPEERGKGGRNQQLVLAAYEQLARLSPGKNPLQNAVVLSGGTDGEDGPTDAAGAYLDEKGAADAAAQNLDPASFLRRNDAYHFFEPLDRLIKTGPTHTNVCDVRVVVISRP
jgi:hydroxypyruvate reductase